jgi:hypothetical protein
MMSMAVAMSDTDLPPEEEKQIKDALRHVFRTGHPNPERVGCPAFAKDIKALAWHRNLDQDLSGVLEHIRRCSPCYLDHRKYLGEYKAQQRFRKVLIAAASVLFLFVGISLLVQRTGGQRTAGTATTTGTQESVKSGKSDKTTVNDVAIATDLSPRQRATLNLESALRGKLKTVQPLVLPRGKLTLSIQLPLGAREGEYKARVFSDIQSIEGEGTTRIDHENVPTLTINDFDTSRLPPGKYHLGIKRGLSEWTEFFVQVK